jgi:CubicO group peptidase (beta-lactamase class C family)
MRDCVQNIANAKLETTPGSAFGYGGSDYQVAGYIATVLSGLAWQDFFNQRIATPLGMSSFSFSLASEGNATNPNVAGGGNTSVKDYALFLQAVLNGGKNTAGQAVLSKQFLDQYGQSQIAGLPVTYTPETSNQPGYSYGWFIAADSLHPGSAGPEISDPGLYGSTPWVDLDVGYAAALFIQSNVTTGAEIQSGVRPLILQLFNRS